MFTDLYYNPLRHAIWWQMEKVQLQKFAHFWLFLVLPVALGKVTVSLSESPIRL